MASSFTEASVIGVAGNIVTIKASTGSIMKNQIADVCVGKQRLKAEVLRVFGDTADLQVFEDTSGVQTGDRVELFPEMLSVALGPGLLGTVYDGLQNPLHELAERDGFFLKRGSTVPALREAEKWEFTPTCSAGDRVTAGSVLGTVQERNIVHKIMTPFGLLGDAEVVSVEAGKFTVNDPVVVIRNAAGNEQPLTLAQRWPTRRPLPANLLRNRYSERLFPTDPMVTTTRIIDTFYPIAQGGTACIPGPFGAGKTVLQGLVARYSSVDVVIVVACGERAGEVLETITEFSEMEDPRTGGMLIDRTIIICNTSSMPVAAREASIYTGITLGEYYRQMGLDVLLIADSTSRWAQAMRETSGRLEEIPGEEAFPAYLDSAIKGVYERAGVVKTNDGSVGSLTMVGTVSPAGGNFEEPVTQSTLGAVKCFLGLSYDRAYKRFYPAIDPLISWSRYLDQLAPYFDQHIAPNWTASVKQMHELLHRGDAIYQMMQVTGEEGVTMEDFTTYHKAQFLDMVYLQQDAFDKVDVSVSTQRQKATFMLVKRFIDRDYLFEDKTEVRDFFTRLTGAFKNLNYAPDESEEYDRYIEQIESLGSEVVSGTGS